MMVNAKDESTADDRVMESANEKLESFIFMVLCKEAVEEESARLVKSMSRFPSCVFGQTVVEQTAKEEITYKTCEALNAIVRTLYDRSSRTQINLASVAIQRLQSVS